MDALNAAIHARLAAHAGFAALGVVSWWDTEADDGTPYPYVVFTKAAGTPSHTFGNAESSKDFVYYVTGHARQSATRTGREVASLIQAEIISALHDATLAVSGKTCLNCSTFGDIPPACDKNLSDRAQDVWSEGAMFRVTLA